MITWPSWMPEPTVTGYGYQPEDRRTRTDMEIGGVYRVEFDTDETTCQCQLILTPDEAAWFEGFEQRMLKQGSVWFRVPLLFGGRHAEYEVNFAARPQMTRKAGQYLIYTFSLNVADRETLCEDHVELLFLYSPAELRAMANAYCAMVRTLGTMADLDWNELSIWR